MGKTITVDEWLLELERIQKDQPQQEGFTIREISEAISKPLDTTRRIVESLIRSGVVVPITVRRTSILNNVTRPVPGFRLVKKKR